MTRKTISSFALAALLATGLAFAAPPAAPAEPAVAVQTAPAEQPALPGLEDLLAGGSCEPLPASVKPGCSRTCKVDRDCPFYPEQVCLDGCCVF